MRSNPACASLAGCPGGGGESGGAQAVALVTQGDRIQLHQVRLLGHQDTFMARRAAGAPARVYVHASLIAGDVDFIFGNATLVLDGCAVRSRAGRRAPAVRDSSVSLGRAWDEGVARGEWAAGKSPSGQAVVHDSVLGAHLSPAAPWAASTSRRPFSATGEEAHRFAEFGPLCWPASMARARCWPPTTAGLRPKAAPAAVQRPCSVMGWRCAAARSWWQR